MENITNYCDAIYEIICSLDENPDIKDGDLLIWNDRQRITEWSEFGVSSIVKAEDDRMTIEEAEEEAHIMSEIVDFIEEDYNLGFVGKKCERIRNRCVDNTMGRFLSLNTKDRNLYVKEVLDKMLYISQNHPLAERQAFRRVVVPDLFQDLIKRFQYYNIKLDQILSTFGPLNREALCSLLNIAYKEQPNEKIPNQSACQGLEDLFVPSCRPFVPQFIVRLKDKGIIMNGKYNYSKKNYLAKLVTYMQERGIVSGGKKRTIWKRFYEYFGVKVVSSRNEGIESEEKYIITESNFYKSENKNISEDEERDFALICRVFSSKL